MPFIEVKTSRVLEEEVKDQIAADLAEAIELVPMKRGDGFEICFTDGADLRMGTRKLENGAYLSLAYFLPITDETLDTLNAEFFRIIRERLQIRDEDVYITYREVQDWGVFGKCMHKEKFLKEFMNQ